MHDNIAEMTRPSARRLLLTICMTAGAILAAASLCACSGRPTDANAGGPVTVFAAASTTDAVKQVADLYEKQTGAEVRLNFAASSTLARQIESGAPADVFLSADEKWMDYLADRGLIDPASRRDLLGNRLVVVVPTDSSLHVRMDKAFDFPASFEGRLAVGDPSHVPAGRYAKEALETMGWWPALADRLAPGADVPRSPAVRGDRRGPGGRRLFHRRDDLGQGQGRRRLPCRVAQADPLSRRDDQIRLARRESVRGVPSRTEGARGLRAVRVRSAGDAHHGDPAQAACSTARPPRRSGCR